MSFALTDEVSIPQIVGVIFTRTDLRRAVEMRNPPDLFELRLDALLAKNEEVKTTIGDLRAPLIITARHPREGGSNRLSAPKRRALLLRFLPDTAYVDIELRSARSFEALLREAHARNIQTVVSFHDFKETPSRLRLNEIALSAKSLGADFLKIVTRTDTAVQLTRLLDFFLGERPRMKIAAMGVGRLGRTSRIELAKWGSALNYAHLGRPQSKGQLSIAQLRHILH